MQQVTFVSGLMNLYTSAKESPAVFPLPGNVMEKRIAPMALTKKAVHQV